MGKEIICAYIKYGKFFWKNSSIIEDHSENYKSVKSYYYCECLIVQSVKNE